MDILKRIRSAMFKATDAAGNDIKERVARNAHKKKRSKPYHDKSVQRFVRGLADGEAFTNHDANMLVRGEGGRLLRYAVEYLQAAGVSVGRRQLRSGKIAKYVEAVDIAKAQEVAKRKKVDVTCLKYFI